MKQLTVSETAQWLLEQDNYCIVTHRRPDGDTVGCAAALCLGLRSLGKRAVVAENPQLTEKLRPYLARLLARPDLAGSTVVSVDTASPGLFPLGLPLVEVALSIDHHGSNSGYAVLGCVQPTAACGEVIFDLLERMGVSIGPTIAQALYLAISTDTGCFRYANTTANTLLCAAKLKQLGADTFAINKAMFMTRRMARLRLESHLTQTAEFYFGGKVCVCAIDETVCRELGVTEDDIDDISGFPREIEGVEIGVMLRQVEGGKGKISMRSEPGISSLEICKMLGGGGHAGAAGATVPGGIEAAKAAVLSAIGRYLAGR